MNPRLEIVSIGPAASLQDQGRPGFSRFGLSKGGAMDAFAMAEGAALLGNKASDTAIEMASFGGKFRCMDGAMMVALTGAPMKAELDGQPVPWRSSFLAEDGQLLEIGSVVDGIGTYGYLHIAGGIMGTPEIGSMGTHLRAGIGGVNGKALVAGTTLDVGSINKPSPGICKLSQPAYLGQTKIRILWGAQSNRFSHETRERMLSETFSASHRRDRMAIRLQPMDSEAPFEGLLSGLSDPVQDGEIQMTGDGVPAIVVREHQPTGGYPRIASVISADLVAAAQLPTGMPFKFELVDNDTALQALQQWRDSIAQLHDQLQPVIRSPHDIGNLLDYNLIDGVVLAADSD